MHGSSEANAPKSRIEAPRGTFFSMKSTVLRTSQLFTSSPTSIPSHTLALRARRFHQGLVKDSFLRFNSRRASSISVLDFSTSTIVQSSLLSERLWLIRYPYVYDADVFASKLQRI